MNRSAPQTKTSGAAFLRGLISIFRGITLAFLAGGALWLVISCPVWWSEATRLPLPVNFEIERGNEWPTPLSVDSPVSHIRVRSINGSLYVKFAKAWTQWLYIFFMLQKVLVLFLVATFLRGVVGSIADGEAFGEANTRRLRWVGILLIIDTLAMPGISTLLNDRVVADLSFNGQLISLQWWGEAMTGGFFAGWLALILSEVFRQGNDLREEQSLTI